MDNVIYAYTRAQAIADGVLVDVSKLAREAGFKIPVAVTAGVWAECVAVPKGILCQDETGRLWDVLMMLRHAIATSERGGIALISLSTCGTTTRNGHRPLSRSTPCAGRGRRRAGGDRDVTARGLKKS